MAEAGTGSALARLSGLEHRVHTKKTSARHAIPPTTAPITIREMRALSDSPDDELYGDVKIG